MARKIAVLPGDGIGPEVMDSAIEVLEKAWAMIGPIILWPRPRWAAQPLI